MFLRPLDGLNVQRAIQSGRAPPFDISSPPTPSLWFYYFFCSVLRSQAQHHILSYRMFSARLDAEVELAGCNQRQPACA